MARHIYVIHRENNVIDIYRQVRYITGIPRGMVPRGAKT